jgi:NAD(P)-dependent dehydrogenase (short-subunit alcohol dehydrogenase family)
VPGVAVVTGAGRGFGRAIAQRLAGRGYDVVATDLDPAAAEATAELTGGLGLELDVRDPEAHRAAARAASERGPLEVWVNNAGVMSPGQAWRHSDEQVRLMCEVNLLGVIWGSRAAVEAMRAGAGPEGIAAHRARPALARGRHILNIASLSALGPVPGLGVYSATKHAVLGFTGSLQGDLLDAGIPITVHALCPDGADTELLREHDDEPAAAINWSGPRLLTADEVAGHAVALLDSSRLVRVVPRWRGIGARAMAIAGRSGLRLAPMLRKQGARNRIAFRDP